MDWMHSPLMSLPESSGPKSRWTMKNEPSIGWRCQPKTRAGRPKKASASFKSKCWISTITGRRFLRRLSPSRWVTSILTLFSKYTFFWLVGWLFIRRFACFKHPLQRYIKNLKRNRINIDINWRAMFLPEVILCRWQWACFFFIYLFYFFFNFDFVVRDNPLRRNSTFGLSFDKKLYYHCTVFVGVAVDSFSCHFWHNQTCEPLCLFSSFPFLFFFFSGQSVQSCILEIRVKKNV